eukprot:sb/3474723/
MGHDACVCKMSFVRRYLSDRLLLHKTLYGHKVVKLLLTLLELPVEWRNEPHGEAGWVIKRPLLEAHPRNPTNWSGDNLIDCCVCLFVVLIGRLRVIYMGHIKMVQLIKDYYEKNMNRPNQEIMVPDWLIISHVT